MAQSRTDSLFRTKSIAALVAASEHPAHRLRKSLGLGSLVALGVGVVIGSGIFTLTGTAAMPLSAFGADEEDTHEDDAAVTDAADENDDMLRR